MLERLYFFVCHKHKTFWNVGSNLFDGWRHENEKIWRKNSKLLRKYEEIDGFEILQKLENQLEPEFLLEISDENFAEDYN